MFAKQKVVNSERLSMKSVCSKINEEIDAAGDPWARVDLVHLVCLFVRLNQIDQTDRTNQMNTAGWRTVSASC